MITRFFGTSRGAALLHRFTFRLVLAFGLAGFAQWLTMELQGQHWHF